MDKLKIVSIFLSIQGECSLKGQGSWTVFVRSFGCNSSGGNSGKGCNYCDSQYTYDKNTEYIKMTPQQVLDKVRDIGKGHRHITLTGGEILEQNTKTLIEFLSLCEQNAYKVSIETNGLLPFTWLTTDSYISLVTDYKTLSAGKHIIDKIRKHEYMSLRETDFIKFVISDKTDFNYAYLIAEELRYNGCKAKIYFSPCIGKISPEYLFKLMKNLDVHLLDISYNLQIHKFIFDDNFREEEK